MPNTDRRTLANAIRALSMDAVQQANSGHPGAPMGMADIAEVLWRDYLQHNPANPKWPNRDRFILSNGHGSMLLYSLLHLSGYDLALEDLKQFRQLHSKTPGHPEYGYTEGVETTTGPLGQGIANAVGMALAEKTMAAQFNRPGFDIVDHYTYAFVGDGCLMEGISHEVCSLAGTQQLGKLIVFYDDNGISIDGDIDGWFTDDTPARFRSYNWQVIADVDGHDANAIIKALEQARSDSQRPTLICCKTTIGFGSPNRGGSHDCHGAPLGEEEIAETRKALNWPYDPFEIPAPIADAWNSVDKGQTLEALWQEKLAQYAHAFPEVYAEFKRRTEKALPEDWSQTKAELLAYSRRLDAPVATRKCSQNALQILGKGVPELLGGSADLAPSNLTMWSGSNAITPSHADGNYLHYGVREFGMTAIMNGMALYGGFIPYGGTFLMFMEYARNAVRMSALMNQRVIHVYTHDSIGLGEDGPTHQPVEQLTALRVTPNLHTWRPCDQFEASAAWISALERNDGPSAFILSRQNLPQQSRTAAQEEEVFKGGYILQDCDGEPELILIATGSEIMLATDAATELSQLGTKVRVVSMPCAEKFAEQSHSYQEKVLPNKIRARVAIECGHKDYWFKFVGIDGAVIGINRFGESAPADKLMELFGFTKENVVQTGLGVIKAQRH
ncbi:transketolase [Maribrevibacterium harenarium]|uniref:Transketolase n=2 Tax=Maribrevibacterium harenarium TaxID=2589817 RepID=A0A501X3J1_9GAMM|nr:transketolase [Maribrevibacterium harenarium]TPE55065.1 transketolase [Maribrevibacterium harenarium]